MPALAARGARARAVSPVPSVAQRLQRPGDGMRVVEAGMADSPG